MEFWGWWSAEVVRRMNTMIAGDYNEEIAMLTEISPGLTITNIPKRNKKGKRTAA